MSDLLECKGLTFQVRVTDYEKGVRWYSNFLGREADFYPHERIDGNPGFSEWELIKGSNCWLQVEEGEPAPGSGPVRLGVVSIEEELGRISEILEEETPEIGTTPDGKVKFCTIEDPFGNRVGFFEEIF